MFKKLKSFALFSSLQSKKFKDLNQQKVKSAVVKALKKFVKMKKLVQAFMQKSEQSKLKNIIQNLRIQSKESRMS